MGKTTKKIIWPIIIFLIWLIFCYKFFLKGLIPIPLDFLTNFYNPWQAYRTFPIKNPAIPDVVSQILPWKIYTIQGFKKGQIPFWNPYNFSGTPHLANFQSASFSPFSFLFFIFSFETAWGLFILFQPLLAGLFTFFYCQKIKLQKTASLLAAVSFAFCGFLTVWLEYGTLGWAILWLPLTLLLWEAFWEEEKWRYWLFINLVVCFSLLAGHLQISLYLILANLAYLLFNFLAKRFVKKRLFIGAAALVLPFFITAFQFLPTMEYYFLSPRSREVPLDWFKGLRMPFCQLITLFFPDFFGHPATRNQWGGGSYVEMMGYVGILPMVLAIFYLVNRIGRKNFSFKDKGLFFISLAFISLILALPTPFSNLIVWLKLPVLSSSAPSRIICLTSFSLAILAGFGWQSFTSSLEKNKKKIWKFLLIFLALFLLFLSISYFINKIAFRNMVFPLGIFGGFLLLNLIFLKFKKKRSLFFVYYFLFIILVLVDLFRFWHKFLPFGAKKNLYPELASINFLRQNAGNFRLYGILEDNLNLPFRLYSTSGYDSLNIIEYQKLVRASKEGLSELPARVTAESIAKDGKYSKRLMDVLGVKYVIAGKADVFAFKTWQYPESFHKAWEDKNFIVFENKDIWPRFLLTRNYKYVQKAEDSLQELLKMEEKQIVINEQLEFMPEQKEGEVLVKSYQANKIELKTDFDFDGLLFVSDSFYPGWQAFVDKRETSILKANYAFRSVIVPKGKHQVKFIYRPKSFCKGIVLSLAALIIIIFTPLLLERKWKH